MYQDTDIRVSGHLGNRILGYKGIEGIGVSGYQDTTVP